MRISDWSSDVCSSDLNGVSLAALLAANPQISNPGLIYPGDSIDIPGGNAGPADAANGPAAPATDVSPANGEFDYNRISGVEGNPNVTPEFINEVEAMAARLGTKPEYLMAVMSFETGASFSPAQANNAGSGATGLIQFMPNTAAGLGTSTAALAQMSSVEQLQYVEQYFMERAGAGNGNLSTLEGVRSEEHTSELQSLMRISYAVFCLKKKKNIKTNK